MDEIQVRTVPLRELARHVSEAYGVTTADLVSERLTGEIVRARLCLYWLARRHTLHSYPTIGRVLRRDHSTVLSGQRKHAARMQSDPQAARLTFEIEARISEVTA
jgi:chromosomal replication initiation ATPase DnaA